jgi:hypothetical protein
VGKLCLPSPLLHLSGPSHLTTIAVEFEAGNNRYAPLYPHAPSVALSLTPSLCLVKKEKRDEKWREQKKRKIGSDTKILKVLPSFLLEPWQSRTGLLPPLH